MLAQLTDPEILASLLALATLEIVLGIDNIVFIAIMVQRVPKASQKLVYRLGLSAALISRLALLFALNWIAGLTASLFEVFGNEISGRDLVMLLGGAFLMFKATSEIFEKVEHSHEDDKKKGGKSVSIPGVIAYIMVIDIIFSLDSVITAVGIARELWVMATAMIAAVLVMLLFAQAVGDFVNRHPGMQILALSFLLLIGVLLIADGFGQHVSKGYVYFAMAFSLAVEVVNMRRRSRADKLGVAANE